MVMVVVVKNGGGTGLSWGQTPRPREKQQDSVIVLPGPHDLLWHQFPTGFWHVCSTKICCLCYDYCGVSEQPIQLLFCLFYPFLLQDLSLFALSISGIYTAHFFLAYLQEHGSLFWYSVKIIMVILGQKECGASSMYICPSANPNIIGTSVCPHPYSIPLA